MNGDVMLVGETHCAADRWIVVRQFWPSVEVVAA